MKCADFKCDHEAEPGRDIIVDGKTYHLCVSCYCNWKAGFAARRFMRERGEDYNPVEVKFEKGEVLVHVMEPREAKL